MQTLCMYKAMSTRLQPDRFCFPDVANQLDFECRYVRLDFPPLIKTSTTPQQAGRASFFTTRWRKDKGTVGMRRYRFLLAIAGLLAAGFTISAVAGFHLPNLMP